MKQVWLALILVLFVSLLSAAKSESADSPSPRPTTNHDSQGQSAPNPAATEHDETALATASIVPSPAPDLSDKSDKYTDKYKYEAAEYRLNRLQVGFNGALVVFTFCLVVVGAFQARRLRQTLEHMRESSEKELRAYVNLSSAKILNIEKPGQRRAQVTIRNFGRTPAYNVTFIMGVHTRELPLRSILLVPTTLPRMAIDILAPTRLSRLEVDVSDLSDVEERELKEHRAAIYVWGRVSYRDAFGQDRWTDFRLFCGGDFLISGNMAPHEQGNKCD